MPLTLEETRLLNRLYTKWQRQRPEDERNEKYYEARQRIEQLGISIPPEVEPFAFPMDWCRQYVETVEQRMDVQRIIRSGEIREDKELRADWEVNNLDLEAQLAHRDLLVYARCVATVSWPDRELGQTRPVIRVESPRAFAVEVNPLTRMMTGALRVYTDETGLTQHLALYLPNETIYLTQHLGRWEVGPQGRRRHDLGRVPVVVQYTRRKTGTWQGISYMAGLMPWVDMAGRVVLNLQLAMETVATPQKVAQGLTKTDFIDPDTGEELDPWETYLGAIWAISATKKDGVTIEQLPAGDLKGFIEVMEMITKQVASSSGLPLRMLGHSTVNPASEGGIKADEAKLIRVTERVCSTAGVFWGWVMGISERIRTGTWPDGSTIQVEWRDASTPTKAEEADAIQKKTGGTPVLSVRGAMQDMGWSQPRIDQELAWLDQERTGYYTETDTKLERQFQPDPDDTPKAWNG